jgi:CheY-like chemotaxis protein
MADPTRILLADDHALVRRGVKLILDNEPDLTVVAEAADGAEAIEKARIERPDLAILDIAMPRLTGLQAARELSRQQPELRILILTMHDNEQFFFESLRAGASCYVLKSVADRDWSRPAGPPSGASRSSTPARSPHSSATTWNGPGTGTPSRPRPSPTGRRRSSSWSPRATPPGRSPTCSTSASRRSNGTGRTCWPSSACATAWS